MIHMYMYIIIYQKISYTTLSKEVRSQTSDNMERWEAEMGRVREEKWEKQEDQRKSQRKEDADARKGRKTREILCFSNDLWLRRVEKYKLAKAAGVEPCGQMRDEKLHAVVARSAFPSQNVQTTSCSDSFWKLTCRKSALGCGAKHISKSKCTKHTILGPILEVNLSRRCTPLWREAHFQVKMHKAPHFRTTFERSDVVFRGRCKGLCTLSKMIKT